MSRWRHKRGRCFLLCLLELCRLSFPRSTIRRASHCSIVDCSGACDRRDSVPLPRRGRAPDSWRPHRAVAAHPLWHLPLPHRACDAREPREGHGDHSSPGCCRVRLLRRMGPPRRCVLWPRAHRTVGRHVFSRACVLLSTHAPVSRAGGDGRLLLCLCARRANHRRHEAVLLEDVAHVCRGAALCRRRRVRAPRGERRAQHGGGRHACHRRVCCFEQRQSVQQAVLVVCGVDSPPALAPPPDLGQERRVNGRCRLVREEAPSGCEASRSRVPLGCEVSGVLEHAALTEDACGSRSSGEVCTALPPAGGWHLGGVDAEIRMHPGDVRRFGYIPEMCWWKLHSNSGGGG
mmetsp:Transcript_16057/g.32110  ORF Transcript_16057/g.32110 Transcript_16057/m.32110 type:complete len:347 (+) Transcript_16057:764-1804(+)